jgi:hypothetical protein
MITPEARKVLKREKERTGEPFVQIINRGIINLEKGIPSISGKTKMRPSISEKTRARSATSVKEKIRPKMSDKTKQGALKQLNLFAE